MNRILGLGLVLALAFGLAGCVRQAERSTQSAETASYVYFTDENLGFAAQFPAEPSATSKKEEDNGRTFTTYHVSGMARTDAQTMVTVIDGYNQLPIDPGLDEAFGDVHSAMLVERYRSATGKTDASPTIEFGRMDGNLSATTVFPWTDNSGKDMWVYYTVLMRNDGRFYELTGSRPTKGDAVAASASFRLLPSRDKTAALSEPVQAAETEEARNIREFGFKPRTQAIAWDEAKNHIGEIATIEGVAVQVVSRDFKGGGITYLNMGNPYSKKSKNRFQAIVWAEDMDYAGGTVHSELALPSAVQGKRIQVTGKIKMYKGVPEVEISRNSQVRIADDTWEGMGYNDD